MEQDEAKAKFRESDELYQSGQHENSLQVLYKLNDAFPDTKNILFPIARNMYALGRYNEALTICEQLIASFNYPKALELKRTIQAGKVGSGSGFPTSGVPGLDTGESFPEGDIEAVHLSDIGLDDVDMSGVESIIMTPSPVENVAPLPVKSGLGKKMPIFVVVALLLVLILGYVAYSFLGNRSVDTETEIAPILEAVPAAILSMPGLRSGSA